MAHGIGAYVRALSVLIVAALATLVPSGAQVRTNAAGAAQPAKKDHWTVGHTPDGQADLQGVWTNEISTPLERPANLGAKEFYTEAEAAEAAKRGAQRAAARAQQGGPETPHYDDAQFGLDRSQLVKVSGLRTSLIVGPEGRIPAMLPEAKKRAADRAALEKGHEFDGPENRGLAERCITFISEGPPMMAPAYNGNLQIVQGRGYVAVISEMAHHVRLIPTDGRPHLSQNIPQWNGDSVGHWEGDTLVVDTTNFTDKTNFRGSGENLHVVERFTRAAADTLLYQFTVDDPSTWAESWTAEISMPKAEGQIYEYACQEGNYGMAGVLSGARATEKNADAGASAK